MPKRDDKWGAAQGSQALRCGLFAVLLTIALGLAPNLRAQPSSTANNNSATGTNEQQIAALRVELTNAWSGVLKIVNQPVTPYRRGANMEVSRFSPGWFHDGANTPDFNNVDVRTTQESPYAGHAYVTSDLNPGVVFKGEDLEFNPNTKLFYANRSLPKHKLTDAQMQEINRLYRIIGRCRGEIVRLQNPVYVDKETTNTTEGEVIPGQSFEAIRKIPMEKRLLYGGIGIGALVLLLVVIRVVKGRSG